jgi:hypothetical protein
LAISTNLSLRIAHFFTHSPPNVYSKDFLKRIVVFKPAHGVWRRRGEAASAGLSAALYSVYHKLYSEAVVSSVASALALVDVGRFREAVEYVQKAAKALYEAARDVFEQVKVTVQRLVELFVEAVARVLAWVDEHKAYLFLMTAAAAGVVALSAALNMWGLVELEKLAHFAMGMPPFIPPGVEKYSKEEALRILKEAPDPYERFKEIAKAANAGEIRLAEPWESLRVLIMPKSSEEERLMRGGGAGLYSKYREDENYGRALFYATLALEEAFGVYRSALGEYAEGLKRAVQRVEVGEEPFKKVVYVADLGQIKQLVEEEEAAFKKALSTLRERLNEYAVEYGLGDLLDVKEDVARRLAEAEAPELSKFKDVSFGVRAYAALIAYREYALGRRSAFGKAAGYWLEAGGSAWLLYYPPWTAYLKAERAGVVRPVAVEELATEAIRRLFLKPGADHYRGFVELLRSGKLALILEKKAKSKNTESYVFRLYRVEEGGGLKELEGVKLRIEKVKKREGAAIVYFLELDARWRGFFGQAPEAAVRAAGEVERRLPVEDRLTYMLSWVASDVAISKGRLVMGTSHLWQLAETHALFDWSDVTVRGVSLTLEGPKLVIDVETPLDSLDEAIRRSAEYGWLKMLGVRAESWEGLKGWVVENWDVVVEAAVRRLGEEVRSGLEALRDRLNDDKVAREVIASALLLMQAERLGMNETTLRYFGAVISGAIGGDGYVSAAMREVGLTSGERGVALLWAAALAAHGIKAEVKRVGNAFHVIVFGDDAVKLAGLYSLHGPPLLEGDERLINHKLAEAVKLGAEGLNVRWEGLRKTDKGLVAADLIISEGGVAVKYNTYLLKDVILLQFRSTDRSRVELAERLLRHAGVDAEVKKEGSKDKWYVGAATDKLAAGRKELRKALAEIVKAAVEKGWVDAGKAEGWLEKLEKGLTLREDWPKYHVGLDHHGSLVVRFASTDLDSIKQEAQRLREVGLKEGVHFTVKMPEEGRNGYVRILKDGLAYAAWLSIHGSGEQRRLAAEFVEYILQRSKEEGDDVYEKAKEIVKEGKERRSLTLKDLEKKVEIGGREHVVKVLGWSAEFYVGRGGKKLLRIKITAEVDGVKNDYEVAFGRHGKDNVTAGYAVARADAPGGREADAERFSALIKALTGREPRVYRKSDGTIVIKCYGRHLKGFMRYAELADVIEKWLKESKDR